MYRVQPTQGVLTGVTKRNGILSIYGPVLLAAVLIVGAVPGCIMPGCEPSGAAAAAGACSPAAASVTPEAGQRFLPACGSSPSDVSAPAPQPCHGGGCGAVMTHGIPDATTASAVEVPPLAALAQAIDLPVTVAESQAAEVSGAPEAPPPDPLGVRLVL